MILEGQLIQTAANRTAHPIELRDECGNRVSTLDPALLLEYIGRGYEVHGTKRRIRYLRPPGPKMQVRPALPFAECWLNTQAACAWPWMESRGVPLALDGRRA